VKIFSGPTKIAFGFGLGIMAAELAKEIMPAFRGLGRPLLKATVKSGVILARNGRERLAGFRETVEDVTAEVMAEMEMAQPEPETSQDPAVTPIAKHSAGVM
jgi:Protein of unknown function (DUF5132)